MMQKHVHEYGNDVCICFLISRIRFMQHGQYEDFFQTC